MNKRFAIIGAAGYVAPRHLAAIKAVGGDLVAALDPHDSVGILDSYFPECRYFSEFERFDRYCSRRADIDYVSICSPNYLHDAHARFALRIGANAIVEKPVVLNERNLDELRREENYSEKRVYCILQMRLHSSAANIPFAVNDFNEVSVRYNVPRGAWYHYSWKGSIQKSGGLATNIGSHLFDFCGAHFGAFQYVKSIMGGNSSRIHGCVSYKKAEVSFHLSIELNSPKIRQFIVNGTPLDFTNGFEGLHIKSYGRIVSGNGFGLEDARQGVKACEAIRRVSLPISE